MRDLGEYAIPTIEINLTDDSKLDEIIGLFVDINQQGVHVSRFDIVKAMGEKNRLLKSVFDLIAIKQKRQQDIFYKAKSNDFTNVLKHVDSIGSLADGKATVDRMWQSLLEIALFHQSKKHRKPVDILKSFISSSADRKTRIPALKVSEQRALRKVFAFLSRAYRSSESLAKGALAADQTHFYTMITALIASNLMTEYESNESELIRRLTIVGNVIDSRASESIPRNVKRAINKLVRVASDRTTDSPLRDQRQNLFIEAVSSIEEQ